MDTLAPPLSHLMTAGSEVLIFGGTGGSSGSRETELALYLDMYCPGDMKSRLVSLGICV